MTASLSAPYALVGEQTPSQPAHQKSLPPGPPHALVQAAIAAEPKPVVAKSVKPVQVRAVQAPDSRLIAALQPVVVESTTVPALAVEPVIIQTNLPDIPAAGN